MSYFYIRPIIGGVAAGGDRFTIADDVFPFVGRRPPSDSSADRAIDSALRSVPLPAGLITRLGMLVDAMADESTGPADYLGC